jgi:uncharacterized membrane protein YbhN (UPF0104 family)
VSRENLVGGRARGVRRWAGRLAVPIALALLAVSLSGVRGRLTVGCAEWTAAAGGLEVLSVLGFVLVFDLVFGRTLTRRQSLGAGLRAVGATTLLPAGTLIGPAIGARSSSAHRSPGARLTRGTVTFTLLTTLPGLIVLGGVALSLWLGWLPGPHGAGRTLPAVAVALAVVMAASLVPLPATSTRAPLQPGLAARRSAAALRAFLDVIRDGVHEVRCTFRRGDWRLSGSLAYYVCDNAVLWAAFHAYGTTPPIAVIVMGYLVGSLGSLLPLPAGIGAVEGGLIGALALYGAPLLPAAGAVLLYRGISLVVPVALSACAWAVVPLARVADRSATAGTREAFWGRRRFRRRPTADRLGRSHS